MMKFSQLFTYFFNAGFTPKHPEKVFQVLLTDCLIECDANALVEVAEVDLLLFSPSSDGINAVRWMDVQGVKKDLVLHLVASFFYCYGGIARNHVIIVTGNRQQFY